MFGGFQVQKPYHASMKRMTFELGIIIRYKAGVFVYFRYSGKT